MTENMMTATQEILLWVKTEELTDKPNGLSAVKWNWKVKQQKGASNVFQIDQGVID